MTRAKRTARKNAATGASAPGTLLHARVVGKVYMAALEAQDSRGLEPV
ncbi:MAG TPA: hypothetical protein VMV25_09655 [Steroidobacteraceae bacterium]|nr:hypothetical protein [Steroidobacteraceae bacterium]